MKSLISLTLPENIKLAIEIRASTSGVSPQTIIRKLLSVALKMEPDQLTREITASTRRARTYKPRLWMKQTIQFRVTTLCSSALSKRRLRAERARLLKVLLAKGAAELQRGMKPGAPLPSVPKELLATKKVGITLSGETLTKLDKLAFKYGATVHELISVCIFHGEQVLSAD